MVLASGWLENAGVRFLLETNYNPLPAPSLTTSFPSVWITWEDCTTELSQKNGAHLAGFKLWKELENVILILMALQNFNFSFHTGWE